MLTPRFITATSLFDGHDVSINLIRRLLQSQGAEVIHLGHNRSAEEVVTAALQEDAHAIALSSYQGGHNEYFRYMRQLLNERGASSVCIFGGGGGVFTKKEIETLHKNGITKIYTPKDGARLGLQGMIKDMLSRLPTLSLPKKKDFDSMKKKFQTGTHLSNLEMAKVITYIEEKGELPFDTLDTFNAVEITAKETVEAKEKVEAKEAIKEKIPVLGITGPGGAGKSSLIDELLLRWNLYYPQKRLALISVDPSRKKQGALLGDRLRLSSIFHGHFYIRSLATRGSSVELSPQTALVLDFLRSQHVDLICLETSGIGQASDAVREVSDACLYVMTPEFGAPTQLEKIEMLNTAHFIVLNKAEKIGAEDAFKAICKQYIRSHGGPHSPQAAHPPIYSCIASRFGDKGVHGLFYDLCDHFNFPLKPIAGLSTYKKGSFSEEKNHYLIPPQQQLYLQEIAQACRSYNAKTESLVKKLENHEALYKSFHLLSTDSSNTNNASNASNIGNTGNANNAIHTNNANNANNAVHAKIKKLLESQHTELEEEGVFKSLKELEQKIQEYKEGSISYRDKKTPSHYQSLSGTSLPHVALPSRAYDSLNQKYRFLREQNLPGLFPFGAGAFPFKKKGEEPKRMFAGEGGPDRTNKRFHFLCKGENFHRLSTAFDSVTLYGEDPDTRPDIFGKIGESGVSIATLEDMERLYQGFDLTDPHVSVSMTINGPAPILLAMFMNTALRQKKNPSGNQQGKEKGEAFNVLSEEEKIQLMREVRGTVQADILKEDQAQNTCIFSLNFALKMMGDVQAYFAQHKIKKYYTVSVSGYHIAEMGANPITQLAFTLANGFTLVEYYLSRGMKIDDICTNMSFFFSNGMDPEYSVIGQVARKIWAIACKSRYEANLSSQRLKYHIQTSGRSLHAQEMTFNDIRTTLQALLAISDSCNSLHTNAYDEAYTTPTEASVRQAMAIQLILQREFGLNQSLNPLQGSFLREELLEKVEEAVLQEFESLSRRGGVLGAMELMYQRGKIQEESLLYETLKSSGELPIVGVNTFTLQEEASSNKAEIGTGTRKGQRQEQKQEQLAPTK